MTCHTVGKFDVNRVYSDTDSYIHKSGRIGRAGNPGICISLVESKNFPAFKRVIVDHLPLQFHKIEANNGLLVTKK